MTKTRQFIGKMVVVRSGQAGVHIGKLLARDGDRVWLSGAERLWSWKVAQTTGRVASCSEIAVYGVLRGECRIAVQVPLHEIAGVHEIIPLSLDAMKTWGATP